MSTGRERIFQRFEQLGVAVVAASYPVHSTVEEGKALRGDMPGTFTKNLLLKDKKGRLFLIVAHEDGVVNLKTLHTRIGASGQVRFAKPEDMRAALGVLPGALTPLALINDENNAVTVVIDAILMDSEQLNFHPLVQFESVGISPKALLAFIQSCGRQAAITSLE